MAKLKDGVKLVQ